MKDKMGKLKWVGKCVLLYAAWWYIGRLSVVECVHLMVFAILIGVWEYEKLHYGKETK